MRKVFGYDDNKFFKKNFFVEGNKLKLVDSEVLKILKAFCY